MNEGSPVQETVPLSSFSRHLTTREASFAAIVVVIDGRDASRRAMIKERHLDFADFTLTFSSPKMTVGRSAGQQVVADR
jgi:hypothetical protein